MKSWLLNQGLLRGFACCMAFLMLFGCAQDEADAPNKPVNASSVSAESSPFQAASKSGKRAFGKMHHGEATYYRATGEGHCSFERSDDLMVAAINTLDYAGAAKCGAYIRVSGPKRDVTVRIVDRCPGCGPGGIDLSREAFEQIAQLDDGRVDVSWQIVAGPVTGPVIYHYMDGTTRYWTAIQVRNHRWPIATLEIMPNGSDKWLKVERRIYNYFVRSKTIASGPLRARITAVTGEVLEDRLPEPEGGKSITGQAQFH